MRDSNNKDIFMGRIMECVYEDSFDYYRTRQRSVNIEGVNLYVVERLHEEKEICRVTMDTPELNVGECIYINEINKKVEVIDKTRTTDNEIIYLTSYVFDVIDIKPTRETLDKIENKREQDAEIKRLSDIKLDEMNRLNDKKWYQFWIR